MSAYDTADYEFSFAKRTLKNLEFIKKRVAEEKASGKSDDEITDAFEVTQLINSFVGLLIIPRERCFNCMPDNIAFPKGSEAEKLFQKIKSDLRLCEDTYYKKVWDDEQKKLVKTDEIEEVTPKILALRLRNAVAHDHLIIQPQSPGKDKPITGIEFSDIPTRKREAMKEHFMLKLSVDETEIFVKALCELLLSCYPNK